MPRLLLLSITALLTACGGGDVGVGLVFPDRGSHEATKQIATTAFEPFVTDGNQAVDLIECSMVGVFAPASRINPERGDFKHLKTLGDVRVTHDFPSEDWSIDFAQPQNPWGAVMIFIEARQDSMTLLQGCTCFRTKDGSSGDLALDRSVENACPRRDDPKRSPDMVLASILPPTYHFEPCDVRALTVPKNQRLAPGPGACVRVDPSQLARGTDPNVGAGSNDCFPGPTFCTDSGDLSRVPVHFEIDQTGGTTRAESEIAVTDMGGAAHTPILADACVSSLRVRGAVVGTMGTDIEWIAACVDPPSAITVEPDTLLSSGMSVKAISTIPGAGSDPDLLAVLYRGSSSSVIEIRNPAASTTALARLEFQGETGQAIHGFSYQLGASDRMGTRPALAVALSIGDALRIYLYAWKNGALIPEPGSPFTTACGQSMCSTNANGCSLTANSTANVHFSSADVDGDGFSDLAIASSESLPITVYRSGDARALGIAMYVEQGCACGSFSRPPETFELIRLGTPDHPLDPPLVDLVLGGMGGASLKYGVPDATKNDLLCGVLEPISLSESVRDLRRGRFQCASNPGSPPCENFEDAVILGGPMGGVRVLFGASRDLGVNLTMPDSRPDGHVDLIATPIAKHKFLGDPDAARTGPLNGDAFDDLAVLYPSGHELHVWLGAGNRALGELSAPIDLDAAGSCSPLADLALASFDKSKAAKQIVIVCDALGVAKLRRYVPQD